MSSNKLLILLAFFAMNSFQNVQAQLYSDDLYWTTTWLQGNKLSAGFQNKGYALVKGSFLYNSTAVTNDFVTQELYQQKTPNAEDTKFSVDRLKDHNTLGADVNASIAGGFRLADTSWLMDVGIGYRDFTYLYFTKDLFKLTFEDYTQYVDKYAQVGASNMREYNYSTLFVGLQKTISPHIMLGARVSLIKGGFYQEVNIEKGSLYLSDSMFQEYAQISAPFQYYSQERQLNPFAGDNGWGAGVDLYSRFCFNNTLLTAEVRDLGFVNWKNMDAYIGDKTYRYNGYNIADLLQPNNIGDPTPDEVAADMGIPKQRVSRRTSLPTKIQVGILQKLNQHVALKADVNYMFLPGYKPYLKATALFSAGHSFYFAPGLVAGGYGKINSQIGLGVTLGDSWSLQLNVMALEYLMARKNYAGHGVDIFLAKSF
ncbi:MAG: hypothetical protein JWM14_1478 [Chitinophagaceae bacterium]|nr:hypothetical protein [Chitinophagaceae bacterium]